MKREELVPKEGVYKKTVSRKMTKNNMSKEGML